VHAFNELPRCSADAILWAVWLNTRRAGSYSGQATTAATRTWSGQKDEQPPGGQQCADKQGDNSANDTNSQKRKRENTRAESKAKGKQLPAQRHNSDGENAWKMCKWHQAIYNNCWPRRGQTI